MFASKSKISWSGSVLPVVGGLVFLLIFNVYYSKLNPDFYALRDDGIITLSHAKNLVDYGFIGVGPSGERLEGYSAPVQFLVYALAYWLCGVSFSEFAEVQTQACTFALGSIFVLFFRDRRCFAVVAAIATAVLLGRLTPFIQWHGSGMENALTHVLFALTTLVLFQFALGKQVHLWMALVPFLASISRLEAMYHIFPLLVIFATYFYFVEGKKDGVVFLIVVMVLWAAYHAWRYLYFGDLKPNTAYAQEISIAGRILGLFRLDRDLLASSFGNAKLIFSSHGGYLSLLALPLLVFVTWRSTSGLLFAMTVSIACTSFSNPFVFGPTRLDVTRSTTQMAFFSLLSISCVLYLARRRQTVLFSVILLPAILFVDRINYRPSYDMCCRISYFDSFRRQFSKISEDERLPRPTVSNPDLGVVSWYKQFNIVDLGMLGSKIMAKLAKSPFIGEYFFEYAAPDIIESHGMWTCRYNESIFSDKRFRERYDVVWEEASKCPECGDDDLIAGIWVRKDIRRNAVTAERVLIDDLLEELSVERLRRELATCQESKPEPSSCVYVARSAYRFLPEFTSKGDVDELLQVFRSSRTRPFDYFLLTGARDGKADDGAIAFITASSAQQRTR
jgi:hypothetical protein